MSQMIKISRSPCPQLEPKARKRKFGELLQINKDSILELQDTFSIQKEKTYNPHIRNGSYPDYYKFRPFDSRPQHFQEILQQCLAELIRIDENGDQSKNLHFLDIGCNIGKLTKSIVDVIQQFVSTEGKCIQGIAVDISKELIEEATRTYNSPAIEYAEGDISALALSQTTENPIKYYLDKNSIKRFDFVSCCSMLMYVHLNHGDEGLRNVLDYICSMAKILVLELQAWSKYRDQVRRMKREGGGDYPHYKTLKWKGEGTLEQTILDYVIGKGFKIVCDQQEKNEYRRSIVILAKTD